MIGCTCCSSLEDTIKKKCPCWVHHFSQKEWDEKLRDEKLQEIARGCLGIKNFG